MPHATADRRNTWRYERARQLKKSLLAALGGCCCACGSRRKLEINHIYGRDWQPNRTGPYYRWLRYWKEFRHDPPLIDLRCKTCNRRYQPIEMQQVVSKEVLVDAHPF